MLEGARNTEETKLTNTRNSESVAVSRITRPARGRVADRADRERADRERCVTRPRGETVTRSSNSNIHAQVCS